MPTLKLIEIDGETGAILPDEMLAHLKAKEGDTVYLIEGPNGFTLTADAEFYQQSQTARKVMKNEAAVLRDLSK